MADLNADGVQDIAVTNQNSNTVSVFLGNAVHHQQHNSWRRNFPSEDGFCNGRSPTAIVSGAFAAGTLDLIVANFADNSISMLLPNVSATTNKPDGTFTTPFTIATGTGPIAMVVADFNGETRRPTSPSPRKPETFSPLF